MKTFSCLTTAILTLGLAFPSLAAETEPARMGSGVMTFDTVPGWGLGPDGKSVLGSFASFPAARHRPARWHGH